MYLDKPRESINIFGLANINFLEHDGNITFDFGNIEFNKSVTVLKIEFDGEPNVKSKLFQQEDGHITLPVADKINPADTEGLVVTRIILNKSS